MRVVSLRAAGNTVVASGGTKIVTWNLPARGHVLNPKANVKKRIRTTKISCPGMGSFPPASISPDLHRIAIEGDASLHLHDVPTGRCLGSVPIHGRICKHLWFSSDGRQVWYITEAGKANGLTIVEDSKSGVIKLEHLGPTSQPSNTPWLSSRGYKITGDGWILGISGKRLLRLPPHWWSSSTEAGTWSGRFLALLWAGLPEVIILELEE
ncbi:hypothetical protein BDM02DRAFT_3132856 [Thelephora ganbajun]|uniref:Uncharacterized protein n=1 Tax=Thelephora ganbajun TaxID=370292 RepID=A0ACB6YZV9_THEGA|nr:hypothetical protein BDM02DRAFT_3132856 [Thelephora ganbajun]